MELIPNDIRSLSYVVKFMLNTHVGDYLYENPIKPHFGCHFFVFIPAAPAKRLNIFGVCIYLWTRCDHHIMLHMNIYDYYTYMRFVYIIIYEIWVWHVPSAHTHRHSREQQSADARDYSARVPSVCSCALNYFLSYIIFIHFVKSLGAWNRWVLKIQKCSVRYSSIVVLVRIVFSLFHFRVRLLRLLLPLPLLST